MFFSFRRLVSAADVFHLALSPLSVYNFPEAASASTPKRMRGYVEEGLTEDGKRDRIRGTSSIGIRAAEEGLVGPCWDHVKNTRLLQLLRDY